MLNRFLFALLALTVILLFPETASATKWGPTANSFNYWAADSAVDGGSAYSWRSVTNSAKTVQYGFANQHDDSFESNDTTANPVPLPIGFNFRFFGRIYTHLYINTNGAIHLVNIDPAHADYNANKYSETDAVNSNSWDMMSASLPRFASDNAVIPTIGVWMEDMNCVNAQLVYGYVSSGSANECIVTFQNMAYFTTTLTSQIICQVVLQSSGRILCQYYTTLAENDIGSGAADPGVGICGVDPLGATSILTIYTRNSNSDGVPTTYSCITFEPPPPPPTITVVSPNGGNLFFTSDFMVITWTVQNGPLPGADISISRDGGFVWTSIATNQFDNNGGSYSWVVEAPPSTLCLIRVSDTTTPSTFDVSDNVFEIRMAPPGFTVTSPSPLSTLDFMVGETMHISWVAVGTVGNIHIYVSRDYGVNWTQITATPINPKTQTSYDWVITAPHTDGIRRCFVRISDGTTQAVSQAPFAIFDIAVFNVTYPNGGESVFVETPTVIRWNTQGLVGFFVTIELSRDNGINWETITGGTNNDGDFDWTPTAPLSSSCLIRITTSHAGNVYTDVSDNVFTISETAALAITSPNGGETFTVGQTIAISWNSRGTGVGNFVKIDISRDAGQSFETISDMAQNLGYFSWTVTGPTTDRAILRISPVNNPAAHDVSDGVFEIAAALGLYMLNPSGGETYYTGEVVDIKWFTSGNTGTSVKIELSRDAGLTWETIVTDTPNDGSHSWVVGGALSGACLLRIKSIQYPSFFSVSAGLFRLTELIGTNITQPYAGDIWETATYRPIRWKESSFTGESGITPLVRIELFRKGLGWETIVISTENDGLYYWYVSTPANECYIRISSLENLAKNYTSDTFSIIQRYAIAYDALGFNTGGKGGTVIPFRFVVNPEDPITKIEATLNFDKNVFTIPEVLAVVKGASFTGWVMNVNINNETGVVNVVLSNGFGEILVPAEAFTINFSVRVGAPVGEYTIGIDQVKINNALTPNILEGKITITDSGGVVPTPDATGGGGGGGCFVATAAFGSMNAASVAALCSVRDAQLGSSACGNSLVASYYAVSPVLTSASSASISAVIRSLLRN